MKQLDREAAGQARVSGEVDLAASAFRQGTYDAIRPLQHDPDREPAGQPRHLLSRAAHFGL